MEKYTDLNDIKSYTNRKNYIGSGNTAKIYKYNNYIIKLFNNKGLDKDRYEYLMSINNESYLFPKSLILHKNKIIGYITNYIDGKSFNNITYNHNLCAIISKLDKIDTDTFKISKNGIRILDLSDENIMLDSNNNIKITDTDEYGLCGIFDTDKLSSLNLISIRKQLFKYLLNTKKINDIDNMNLSTLEIIRNIISDYSNKYDVNIDTVTKLRYISSIENHLSLM